MVSADLLHGESPCHALDVVRGLLVTAVLAGWCGCGNGAPPQARGPVTEATLAPVVVRSAAPGASASAPASGSDIAPIPAPASDGLGNLYGADRMGRVFGALAGLEEGHAKDTVRIVQYGDSHTASDLGVSVLRHALQARFGDAGRGFVSIGKPWKT